jgi:hypothetical protein
VDVMQLMLLALKSDLTNPLGQRQINSGLKESHVKTAFKKLHIVSKRTSVHYSQLYTINSKADGVRSLQLSPPHKQLKEKYSIHISYGYLYIDFDAMRSVYVGDQLVIPDGSKCNATTSHHFPKPHDDQSPWVFVIQEVWQTYPNEVPALLYMGVADVWATDSTTILPHDKPDDNELTGIEIQRKHTCTPGKFHPKQINREQYVDRSNGKKNIHVDESTTKVKTSPTELQKIQQTYKVAQRCRDENLTYNQRLSLRQSKSRPGLKPLKNHLIDHSPNIQSKTL